MIFLKSVDEINNFINDNEMVFLYFSTEECNVCKSLFPKVDEMLKKYPDVHLRRIDMNKNPEVAGKFSIFTIPTILFFINGSETIRKGRFISVEELEDNISRYYDLIKGN